MEAYTSAIGPASVENGKMHLYVRLSVHTREEGFCNAEVIPTSRTQVIMLPIGRCLGPVVTLLTPNNGYTIPMRRFSGYTPRVA